MVLLMVGGAMSTLAPPSDYRELNWDNSHTGTHTLPRKVNHPKAKSPIHGERASGTRVFLIAEWPRNALHGTAYVLSVYQHIADVTEAVVVPVGALWDSVLKHRPNAGLWSPDVNHSAPAGAYVAAASLAKAISGSAAWKPSWRPGTVSAVDFDAVVKALATDQPKPL